MRETDDHDSQPQVSEEQARGLIAGPLTPTSRPSPGLLTPPVGGADLKRVHRKAGTLSRYLSAVPLLPPADQHVPVQLSFPGLELPAPAQSPAKESRKGRSTSLRLVKPAPVNPEVTRQKKVDSLVRLYSEVAEISETDPWAHEYVGFLSSGMIQCSLPYRCPDPNLPAWGRTSEKRSLVVQQGYFLKFDKVTGTTVSHPIGYPYGSLPRFILTWIGGEALRLKSRHIVLGNSLNEFLLELGIQNANGGSRGYLTRIKDQLRRLFSARIAILDNVGPDVDLNWAMSSWQLANRMQFWWSAPSSSEEDPSSHDYSHIELSEKFFEELCSHPVPLDLRILKKLARSSFALDLYSWISWRASFTHKPVTIPWSVLHQQFGSDCADIHKFRQLFRRALLMVHAVYPGARFEADKADGFVLLPMPTPLAKKISG